MPEAFTMPSPVLSKPAIASARWAACALLLAGAGLSAAAQGEPPRMGEHRVARATERAQALTDLPYGSDPRQRMDVYLPPAVARGTARAPVVFMVHGGAWRTGDKAQGRVVENKVARWVSQGFVLVSVNYRLLPLAPVTQQVQDVAAALAAAQQRAPEWGADPGQFILMGHSAGAHLVALLNAQPELALRLPARRWLGTVALDSAVLNLPQLMRARHAPLYDEAFGHDPAAWPALSPADQLVAGAPPFLLVCSSVRRDQPCRQAHAMAERVRALGGRASVLPQALGHGEINAQLGLESAYTLGVEDFMASLAPAVAQRLGR